MRIALLTLRFVLTGQRRSEQAVSEANSLQQMNTHLKTPIFRKFDMREVGFSRNQTAAAMLRINAQTGPTLQLTLLSRFDSLRIQNNTHFAAKQFQQNSDALATA